MLSSFKQIGRSALGPARDYSKDIVAARINIEEAIGQFGVESKEVCTAKYKLYQLLHMARRTKEMNEMFLPGLGLWSKSKNLTAQQFVNYCLEELGPSLIPPQAIPPSPQSLYLIPDRIFNSLSKADRLLFDHYHSWYQLGSTPSSAPLDIARLLRNESEYWLEQYRKTIWECFRFYTMSVDFWDKERISDALRLFQIFREIEMSGVFSDEEISNYEKVLKQRMDIPFMVEEYGNIRLRIAVELGQKSSIVRDAGMSF